MLWLIQANGVLRCRLLLLQYKFQLCEAPRALGHASPRRRAHLPSDLLAAGKSFASETVFSHESKLALVAKAQAKGFFVLLLVVCMDDPQRLLKRVSQLKANQCVAGIYVAQSAIEFIVAR